MPMTNHTLTKGMIICLASLFLLSCKGQPGNSAISESRSNIVKHHNKLDDINSAAEIEAILAAICKSCTNFKVNSTLTFKEGFGTRPDKTGQHIADSLQVKAWTKMDFDGNGYTDLLVIGNWDMDHSVMCIMDSGENRFSVNTLTRRSFQDCTFPVVARIDSTPVILYYYMQEPDLRHHQTESWLKVDTLVYQFGDFVEFNQNPANHKIEKIEYSTTGCFGTCPIFMLTINQDRTAVFDAGSYNQVSGKFTATIDTANFNPLINLLNYIDFAKLDSSYSVGWTDDQACDLKITYDNGQVKKISDYGLLGTFGLNRAYELLFKLRENQKWK